MMYISDIIGEDYKTWGGVQALDRSKLWKQGDIVFITSPTGTGKSTFVFRDLLKYYHENGKRILYLVNRRILKDQLETELKTKYLKYRSAIDLMLYQDLENQISALNESTSKEYKGASKIYKIKQYFQQDYCINWLGNYDCVVCDEAHYFLTDSNYNTRTVLSFKFINAHFENKIRIFMSATVKDIKDYICELNEKYIYHCTRWLDIQSSERNNFRFPISRKINEYCFDERNVDLRVKIFKDNFELVSLIGESSKKWVIFVDSMEYGRSLKKEIERSFKENDNDGLVSFVYSNYESDAEAWGEVNNITLNERQESRVLISTSVLDNGINLKDINLRNIAIFADNETEFIQMLGRKRRDNEPVNLYIKLHSKWHFEKRLRICMKRFEKIDLNYQKVKEEIESDFEFIRQNYSSYLLHSQFNINFYNFLETEMLAQQHLLLFKEMMNNANTLEAVKATYFWFNNILMPNILSLRNLENMISFYAEVIDEFDTQGELAFLKRQLSWLGIKCEEAEKLIKEELSNREESSRNKIINEFDKLAVELNNEIKAWGDIQEKLILIKDSNRRDFFNVLNQKDENYNTYYEIVKKNKAKCSKNFIKHLAQFCDIPFTVEKKEGGYIFKRTEEAADCKKIQQKEPHNNPQN